MGVLDKLFEAKKQVAQASSPASRSMTPMQGGLLGPLMGQQGGVDHHALEYEGYEKETDRTPFDFLPYPRQIERLIGGSVPFYLKTE